MMHKRWILLWVVATISWTCQTEYPINTPDSTPMPVGIDPVPESTKGLMEGVYSISVGQGNFGNDAVVKWAGKHMSIFTRTRYFTFDTGTKDSVIYLRGYWRVPTSDDFGVVNLTIEKDDGAARLLKGVMPSTLIIKGRMGGGNGPALVSVMFTYSRPFSNTVTSKKFYIVGHRGGGRTSDRLPISENSKEMIGYAGRFGANGIEIDIRLTKDDSAVLYHDDDINIRLTQKSPLNGPIENFTWRQLNTFVYLIRGERIPTLRNALLYVIDSTALEFVWLDIKDPKVIPIIRPLQEEMYQRAASKGRTIEILIGVPADDVENALKALPAYTSVPSLCEISPDAARNLNSRAWGPRWTLGTQNDLVGSVQAEGRIVICWTIDGPAYINQFIQEGQFDGLLTNYPSYVAYFHYIRP